MSMIDKYRIKRRSSAHSAYWMSNALVPAGLILIYRNGWSVEGVLGVLFIGLGVVGFGIYKQKMSVPLIAHDGERLFYKPSASEACSIHMDATAKFTIRELGLTAEIIDDSDSRFEISRLDFNSNADWHEFVGLLRREPQISLFFEH